jgi:dienelactone hydrolase
MQTPPLTLNILTDLDRYYISLLLYAMIPWKVANRFSVSMPIVKNFFTAVRQNEGARLPIGAAGFCWGGKHTVNLACGLTTPDGKPLLDAGFAGHPSNLEIPGELEKMVKPVSFALGEKDMVIKGEQITLVQEAVAKLSEVHGGEVKVYPGAGHGFCLRADILQNDAEAQAEEAENQAISWLQKHFQKVSY